MPEMSGLDLLRHLQRMAVRLPVIVVTGHGDVQLAVEAMKAGAVDFLEKPFDDERVLEAVRTALDGGGARPRARPNRTQSRERLASLSQRERQVLDGLVAGQPNKTIAYELGISASDGRGLSRPCHDQDAGQQPVRTGPDGTYCRIAVMRICARFEIARPFRRLILVKSQRRRPCILASMSDQRPPLRPCPRCRITMQAGRSDPAASEYDTFTCLRCDLVLSYSRNAETRPREEP